MDVSNYKHLHFSSEEEWRIWLESNHDKEKGIWMVFYKKHTTKPTINYKNAVEQALCFGWIDSIVKRIDEEKYIQKFTPRKKNSNWSDLNIQRVKKLIAEGKMTKAGLSKFSIELLEREPEKKIELNSIPEFIIESLLKNPNANLSFNKLPPSHKRNYIGWICSAKKQETKNKRLLEMIRLLEKSNRLILK